MSKGRPQLPRVKPVGRAALNPPHPHWDDDLAYIMENWPQMIPYDPTVEPRAGFDRQFHGAHQIPGSRR